MVRVYLSVKTVIETPNSVELFFLFKTPSYRDSKSFNPFLDGQEGGLVIIRD